ncbi:A disintegrin and metalloproteinase with thrombospondin motifs [Plakobranchus ocellatus]|uniref:A disintegrin and metalloproteinase with thrombospondin motifs n=1 Tax=Plakobranchus ocellatus TaxID=259542 RepID=A0AAV4BQB8_9GAST|nr:A disintegrin and metalloproteinase with thrombospondin motifs [Plakobranchus ocellatus]
MEKTSWNERYKGQIGEEKGLKDRDTEKKPSLVCFDSNTDRRYRIIASPQQGNFAQDLTHFHVSWPSRVDHHGNFLTYHLHSKADTSSRHRRSVSTLDTIQNDHSSLPYSTAPLLSATASKIGSYQSPESNSFYKSEDHESSSESGLSQEVLHYKIPLHPEKDVVVELQHTRLLLGPSAVVERKVSRFNNISDSLFSKLEHHHGCHLSGVVRGDSSSKAALSACDGLRGFIQIDGVEYLIEPVKGHNKTEDGSHPHLVYRRSALPDHLDFTSRQKRAEPSCGIKEEYTRVFSRRERWERHKRSSSSGRSHDHGSTAESLHSRKRRSISIEKHVETLIVVDPEMVHFYVNEDIETYVLTVMNMVTYRMSIVEYYWYFSL